MNRRVAFLTAVTASVAVLVRAFRTFNRRQAGFEHVMPSGLDVTVSATEAKVGEAVEVSLTGGVELDKYSPLRRGHALNISLGVRFADGPATDDAASEYGSVDGREALPSRYRLPNGANYARTFDDVTVPRGRQREFTHSFSFTLTEPGKVYLVTQFWFATWLPFVEDGPRHGSFFSVGRRPRILFE